MAEVLTKIGTVGADPAPQDGDPIVIVDAKGIRDQSFTILCHWRRARPGWRPATGDSRADSPCYRWSSTTRTTRVIGLSAGEIRVVNRITGDQQRHPYDVRGFVERRKRKGLPIWGAPMRPQWFAGSSYDPSQADIDALWNHIETDTPERRQNWRRWRWSNEELCTCLVLPMHDVARSRVRELQAPETEEVMDRGEPQRVRLRYRRHELPWEALGVPETAIRVRDPLAMIDVREAMSELGDSAFQRKPARPVS